jgi:uncharacterized protein (DUF849 family)
MVAPNGARRTKDDHPNLPITVGELVQTAAACHDVGADALHAHVRDAEGRHILDAGLYNELLAEMAINVSTMQVQITTEAVGQYSPAEQMALVRAVKPKMVSIALRELQAHDDAKALKHFYFELAEAAIDVQHIIYAPDEIQSLNALIQNEHIPASNLSMLFVLGRYTEGQVSDPSMFDAFYDVLRTTSFGVAPRVMTCAFGQAETDALVHAARHKSDVRIGFENNILMRDGNIAPDNMARIKELLSALDVSEISA